MIGAKDKPSVNSRGERIGEPAIVGVRFIKLNNILTRSGMMNEVFRSDWFGRINVNQINLVELSPAGVTDWHCHAKQTDRLIGISGVIKLCLYDARPKSPTLGATETVRMGIQAPLMVILPPGVWHGLRNESGTAAAYLNVIEQLYRHEKPDNFRLAHDSAEIPVRL